MDAVFVLGDKLPLIYDAAIAIHSVSKRKLAREKAIHSYSTALRNMWIKSFELDHVISLRAVKTRITSIMNDYNTKCYKASYNRGKVSKAIPLRSLNKIWRQLPVPVKKNTPKEKVNFLTNNDLLDIGKEMQQLTGNERAYYMDQCSRRIFRLSEEVDEEYEEERAINSTLKDLETSFQEEESFSNPPEFEEIITCNPKGRFTVRANERMAVSCRNLSATNYHFELFFLLFAILQKSRLLDWTKLFSVRWGWRKS
jgi:hypothetical protein